MKQIAQEWERFSINLREDVLVSINSCLNKIITACHYFDYCAMASDNCYEAINCDEDVSKEELKAHYKKIALQVCKSKRRTVTLNLLNLDASG